MKKKRKFEIELPSNETPEYLKSVYPPDEDIFIRNEKFLFIEEAGDAAIAEDKTGIDFENSEEPLTGEDLDIPGAELDDAAEEIGAEDEENNYYSLGGENHHDLEDNHE